MPRNLRRRDSSDEEGSQSDDTARSNVQDILAMQKRRKRVPGLVVDDSGACSASVLSEGMSLSSVDARNEQRGGYFDPKKMKRSDWSCANVEDDLKQAFSRESNLRDEDEEMRKYVEEELAKRKGQDSNSKKVDGSDDAASTALKSVEDMLFAIPERLKKYQSKKTEEMLSNQMLCGIPEVDLGLEAKIRNIEDTEAVKLRLLRDAMAKKRHLQESTTARQNLAKDLAQNFVQHSRYRIDQVTEIGSANKKIERPPTEAVVVVSGDTPQWVQMEASKKPRLYE